MSNVIGFYIPDPAGMLVFGKIYPNKVDNFVDEEEAIQCRADNRSARPGTGRVSAVELTWKTGISEQAF